MKDFGTKRVPESAQSKPAAPSKYKEPTFTPQLDKDGKTSLGWRFSSSDKEGPFAWGKFDLRCLLEILSRLSEFEHKKWDELIAIGCHPISIGDLSQKARKRLTEIEKDDIDELMSFRVTGERRVWCIHTGSLMRVLWWDQNHQVYPTEKDRADRVKRRNRSR